MEKKDLTKEKLLDYLNSEDCQIRNHTFGYCIRQTLDVPNPIIDWLTLQQNSKKVSLNDQRQIICEKIQNLQEHQYSHFFKLVHRLPFEAYVVAYALFNSSENQLDKLCLKRLDNLYGTIYENYINYVLFFRACQNDYFKKQLQERMLHPINQQTDWHEMVYQVYNLKNLPEIVTTKLFLAKLIVYSYNPTNFGCLHSLITEFAIQTQDLAFQAIKHFNRIGNWSSQDIILIQELWNHEVLGTMNFRNKICKIMLPALAYQYSPNMEPIRKLYVNKVTHEKSYQQALEDLKSIPVTKNSKYSILNMLRTFLRNLPQENAKLHLQYCEFFIEFINTGSKYFDSSDMENAFSLIINIDNLPIHFGSKHVATLLNLICCQAQDTPDQIGRILSFSQKRPQYLSNTLDMINFETAPITSGTIYLLHYGFKNTNKAMIKAHYLTALEDIAKRQNLDNQTQFVLDNDVVPQLELNNAQFEAFPNLKKAFERYEARKKLLELLS